MCILGGADANSSSKSRVGGIFRSYSEFEDKERIGIDGFYHFYRYASTERPEYVWDDIVVYNFDTNLKLFSMDYELKDIDRNGEDEKSKTLRDEVIYNKMYNQLLTDLMNRMKKDYDQDTRESISKILFKLSINII